VLYNASSTVETSHTVHHELNRTNPENYFFFSTILNSSDPFATEKRKDLASTKKRLSIPQLLRQLQPQGDSHGRNCEKSSGWMKEKKPGGGWVTEKAGADQA